MSDSAGSQRENECIHLCKNLLGSSPGTLLVNVGCTGMTENEVIFVNALHNYNWTIVIMSFVHSVLLTNIYQKPIFNTGVSLVLLVVYVYRTKKQYLLSSLQRNITQSRNS